jgi:histone-lysine N-methyltransferase SETMAR
MEMRIVMQKQQWEVLKHLPYSPDLAPSNFHLFGPLKHHLSANIFPTMKL